MMLLSFSNRLFLLLLCIISAKTAFAALPYLDDNDYSNLTPASEQSPNFSNDLWPRVILAETKSMAGGLDSFSKYNLIATQAALLPAVATLQAKYPDIRYIRMFTPREFQEYQSGLFCSQGKGIPFEVSDLFTGGCSVYAGHWLYSAGAQTSSNLDQTNSVVKVEDASRFQVGKYVVIYDAPAGSFLNAEHAKIIEKNGFELTLQRAYKSLAQNHSSGSIIAQHVLGQSGEHPLNWSYNLSTSCPLDSQGNTVGTYMAEFIEKNIDIDRTGEQQNINISGILFDVDFYYELWPKQSDVNNDLITDNGVIWDNAENLWGLGIEQFYAKLRQRLPNMPIIGGSKNARGYNSLSGTQIEGWLGTWGPMPIYNQLDSLFSKYIFAIHQFTNAPSLTHALNKQPTKLYPIHSDPLNPVEDNRVFRLGLGMALMDDGYFGHENSPDYPDTWYDEFAVDVRAGSANYGRAISNFLGNESVIREHIGWLGKPKVNFTRIYDPAQFDASKSLVVNGGFESNLDGWSTKGRATLTLDTQSRMDGFAAVKISPDALQPFHLDLTSSAIVGQGVNLVEGNEYTLAFSAKSSLVREISSQVGPVFMDKVYLGPKWRRYIMTFTAETTGSQQIEFQVGQEDIIGTSVWLDSVYLFEGNANIFRRDFDNGIVIANATPSVRTITLGNQYQHILGEQDTINDGKLTNSVTLQPYDATILVNTPGVNYGAGQVKQPEYLPHGQECGEPLMDANSDLSLLVWKDCGTGIWHARASGGGSNGVTYHGTIISSQGPFTNVAEYSLEDTDKLELSGDTLKFLMRVYSSWQDGIEFSLPASADACFSMNRKQMLIGKGRQSVPLPINLKTLGPC